MVDYNPFSPEIVLGDPHPIYKVLRDESPVHYLERWNAWALSRFEDVWAACADNQSFSSAEGTTASHLMTRVQPVTPMINMMDAPEHPKLRAQIKPFFGPRRIARLENQVREFVAEQLDAVADAESFDVVQHLAQPMATFAASLVSGFPIEDGRLLRTLVDRFFARDADTEATTEDGMAAMGEMIEYFAEFSAAARASGTEEDSVVARLLAWEGVNGKLSDLDIASHLSLFLLGGIDTLPKVFANTLIRLEQNPAQRAAVAADSSLVLDAFHEALRIDMPTQFMCRKVVRPVEIRGTRIEPGQIIMLMYTSANRDEREFPDAETYDFKRRPPRMLGFSHGAHACIGLHTARMEARVGLTACLERFPEYEVLYDEAEQYNTEFVKGLSSMPIRING
jgi:cytochrome P450 family 130